MSKVDTSLQEIDITKLLIATLIFLSICVIMFFGFILPNIKTYKILNQDNISKQSAKIKIENFYKEKSKILENLKKEKILSAYENNFKKDDFIKFANNFFENANLRDLPLYKKENYFLYELNVTASIKNPKKFYDFLDELQNYKNIIKTDFPIKMQGNGEKILASFNIKVYGQGM